MQDVQPRKTEAPGVARNRPVAGDPVMTQSGRPLRLIGYVRVSTEEQAREGVSVESQRTRLRAYAEAYGHELVDIAHDNGTSGKVKPARRAGLSSALERIRAGEAGGLAVLKLDRLSRSTRDVLDLVDESNRGGWRLVSVSESLDTGTAAGRLVVTILAALAQMEREQVGERTAEGLAQVAREGRVRSHRTPFGWRTPSGAFIAKRGARERLVPHAQEQQIILRIAGLTEHGWGDHRIARAMNESGQSNPRTGARWSRGTVASIIATRRRYDR